MTDTYLSFGLRRNYLGIHGTYMYQNMYIHRIYNLDNKYSKIRASSTKHVYEVTTHHLDARTIDHPPAVFNRATIHPSFYS